MTFSSTFGPQSTLSGSCGRASITLSLRITSNCPPDLYGSNCAEQCSAEEDMYFCNYLGQRQCLGNFAPPNCTTCLPSYYTSSCSIHCPPPACQPQNYQCDPTTGERVCQGNFEGPTCESCAENFFGSCCSVECMPPTDMHECTLDGELVCIGNFKLPDCEVFLPDCHLFTFKTG